MSATTIFANCVMTLYLLKVPLQTFLSVLITQKYTANERYVVLQRVRFVLVHTMKELKGSTDPLIHKLGTGRR